MVVTQKDQVVTGETAVFDTKTNLVTMLGGVVLTQGKNVLRGDRLMVDMTTGVSRVESDSGRVQGLFQSSGQGGGLPGAPSPATPAATGRSNKPKYINHLYGNLRVARLKLAGRACIYPSGPAARAAPHTEGVSLGNGHPFIHVARANRIAVAGCGITVKG